MIAQNEAQEALAPPANRMTLVLAANASEYNLWLKETGTGRKMTQYISGPEMLYGWGRVNVKIINKPLWWQEEDQVQLAAIMERSR